MYACMLAPHATCLLELFVQQPATTIQLGAPLLPLSHGPTNPGSTRFGAHVKGVHRFTQGDPIHFIKGQKYQQFVRFFPIF